MILTGKATGFAADVEQLKQVQKSTKLPVLIGSGVTADNLEHYISANALIVGSYFKTTGRWEDPVDYNVVKAFVEKARQLRSKAKL